MSSQNPYSPPVMRGSSVPTRKPTVKFPVYTVVVLIIDICFRMLRFIFVGLGVIGILSMDGGDPMYFWGVLEVITGGLMVVCGLLGDSIVLAKKRWGLILCWIAFAASLGNIIVGLCEMPLIMDAQMQASGFGNENTDEYYMGMWIGAGIVLIFRGCLALAYAVALVLAGRYFANLPNNGR